MSGGRNESSESSCVRAHESARLHVTGRARYVADMPGPANTVIGYPVCSTVARGTISKLDFAECLGMPGVLDVLTVRCSG